MKRWSRMNEARSVFRAMVGTGLARDAILGDIARSYYRAGWTYYAAGKNSEAMAALERGRAHRRGVDRVPSRLGG